MKLRIEADDFDIVRFRKLTFIDKAFLSEEFLTKNWIVFCGKIFQMSFERRSMG